MIVLNLMDKNDSRLYSIIKEKIRQMNENFKTIDIVLKNEHYVTL